MKNAFSIKSGAITLALMIFSILFTNNSALSERSEVITYFQTPRNLQFFPRDIQDSAEIIFSGEVLTSGYDSIYFNVYRNNVLWKRTSTELIYSGGASPFLLKEKIHAELSEYKFSLYLKLEETSTLIKTVDSIVCGDAYIISGQSNSCATDPAENYINEFCRSFGSQTPNFNWDPYDPADTNWGLSKADGAINIYSGPYNVGVWGLQLQKMIKETFGIPTCIINGGVSSSAIELNLRNNNNHTDLTTFYGKLLYRVSKSGLKNNIKAIFWYQGESNGDLSWLNYFDNFNTLYYSWKENYLNFNNIFLFQIRPSCSDQYASQLREVQRKLPQTYTDIELLSTAGMPYYEGCHYAYVGYLEIANMVFRPLSKLFYTISDTIDIRPPNIRAAYYTNPEHTEIELLFDNSNISYWPPDTLNQSMKNYFYLNGIWGNVSYGTINGNTLRLYLLNPSNATKITYLPSVINHDDSLIYEGPFLRNSKGIGALSFHDFPISYNSSVTLNITLAIEGFFNAETNQLNIKDTVTAKLRNIYYPYQIIDSAKSVIDSISLTGEFNLDNVPSGTYYIAIEGRNCLETWSKNDGIYIPSGGTVNYDFTALESQAYGNNLKLKGSKYCIYSGDISQDGIIDTIDVEKVWNDIFRPTPGNNETDLDGNRSVDILDISLVYNNAITEVYKITP